MIIGNKGNFAIKSRIVTVLPEKSLRGIGYFLIFLNGKKYGVLKEDATALACSFDSVWERIQNKGKHISPFSNLDGMEKIAKAVRFAIYDETIESDINLNISFNDLKKIIYKNNLLWAPDGDEAFDDGSFVLQFDYETKVRLIGFKSQSGGGVDKDSLSEIYLDSEDFYRILKQWYHSFESEWNSKLKNPSPK